MSVALVQEKNDQAQGTVALSFTSTPSVGSLVVVALACSAPTITGSPSMWTVTDNQGNTYTFGGKTRVVGTPDYEIALFYAKVRTASGTFTVTGDDDGSTTLENTGMWISEWSGNWRGEIAASVASNNGGSATTGDVTVGVPFADNDSGGVTIAVIGKAAFVNAFSTPSGFTETTDGGLSNATMRYAVDYKVAATPWSNEIPTWTWTGAATWQALAITFVERNATYAGRMMAGRSRAGPPIPDSTVYLASLSGSTGNLTGSLVREARKALAGTAGAATGELTKRANKILAGADGGLSGALTAARVYLSSVAGTVGDLTGLLTRRTDKPVSGSAGSISGDLARRTNKQLSGSTGGLEGVVAGIKVAFASLAGTVGDLAGALTRRTNKPLSGATGDASGSLTKRTNKPLAGATGAVSGALATVRQFNASLTGAVGAIAGVLTKRTSKGLDGSPGAISGETTKRTNKQITGEVGSLSGLVTSLRAGLEGLRAATARAMRLTSAGGRAASSMSATGRVAGRAAASAYGFITRLGGGRGQPPPPPGTGRKGP